MALTRITKGVIKPNENYQAGIVTATGLDVNGNGDISGNLNVGGVLTYEDVTSIDSVGIITAQKGIHVGGGVSAIGVGTFSGLDISGDIDVDGHTNLDNVSIAGVVTATTLKSSNLTANRVVFTTTGGQLEASGNLTYNGTTLASGSPLDINSDLDVDGHTELDNVRISGVTTHSDNVSFTTANGNGIIISKAGNYMAFGNSVTQYFGGTSMWLQHNGSTGYLHNVTGGLYIRNEETNGHIYIQGKSGAHSIIAKHEGAVELYYNGTKMLETNIPSGHNGEVILGQKVHVKHTGSGNGQIFPASGNMYLNATDSKTSIMLVRDAGVHLAYNNNFKLVTTNTGAVVTGILTATSFSGSGASLTNLNGSNIASGTVPVARIGTGTKSTSTFYRGDGTFATVTAPAITAINNASNNRVVTSDGGTTVTGEANLTFANSGSDPILTVTNSGHAQLTLTNTSGSDHCGVNFGDSSDHNAGMIQYTNNGDYMVFHAGANEALRIDSSGRVLIGNSSTNTQKIGDGTLQVFTSDRKHPAIRTNAGNANGYTMFSDSYKADESQNNIGISYSSSKLVLSTSVKVSDTADNVYLSSQDTFAAKPCAFTMDHNGVIAFLNTSTSATTTTDSAVSLTERLSITAGGTVKIGGDTENSGDLDVSNTRLTIKQSANNQEDGIYIERSGERRGHYIYVGGALGQSDALCVTTNQLGTDTHILALDRSGNIATGAGNIGINNTNPQEKLQITGGNITFGNRSDGASRYIGKGTNGSGGVMGDNSANPNSCWIGFVSGSGTGAEDQLRFGTLKSGTSGGERMRIDGLGRISVGESLGTHNDASELFKIQRNSASAVLSIIGSNDTHSTLALGDEDDFNRTRLRADHTNDKLQLYVADTERLILQNGGVLSQRVGSNARLSHGILEITTSSTPSQLKITTNLPYSGSGGSHAESVTIRGFRYGGRDTVDLQICWHVYAGQFYNRIASSSGAWAPLITLGVENNKVVIHFDSLGYWPKIYVADYYSSFNSEEYARGWSWSDAAISGDAGTPVNTVPYKNDWGGLTYNDTHAVGTNPDRNLTIGNGNLVVESGHGVMFGGSAGNSGMTSQVLDDYEEGSWTPAYSRPNMTLTHGYQNGFYTKVGRVVHVVGRLYTTAENGSSSGGPILVTGLPFTVREVRCALSVRPSGWSNDHPSFATFELNQTHFELLEEVEGNPSGSTDLTGGRFAGGNGNYLWFSGSYFTDT